MGSLAPMIEENIGFINHMIDERRDLYSILSFISESVDALRTHMIGVEGSDAVYGHLKIIARELTAVDRLIGSE